MLPNIGEIVWIDGSTAAMVVGHGVDHDNIADGIVYVAELGGVKALGPTEDGSYAFGAAPYDPNAKHGTNDQGGQNASPGGFGPDSPIASKNDTTTAENASAASSSSDGAPVTPGAPGSFVGDAGGSNDPNAATTAG